MQYKDSIHYVEARSTYCLLLTLRAYLLFLVKVAGKGVLARPPLVVTLWLLPKWWGRAIYENRAQDDAKIYFLPGPSMPTLFPQIALGPKIRFEVKLQVCTYCYFGDESITRKGNFFNNDHHQGIVRTGAMVALEPGKIW